MRSWVMLILLHSLSTLVTSRKLTTAENERNSKKCGVHFLGGNTKEKQLTKRSIGGRKFEHDEYPWAVILTWEENFCSGVQISPRHILTAAHCVLDYNDDDCATKDSRSIVSVMKEPEDISVCIGDSKPSYTHSFHCSRSNNTYEVTKITVHNYEHCSTKRDIALIEFSANISEHVSIPICMPSEDLSLAKVLFAAGTGGDPTLPAHIDSPRHHSHVQRVVAQKLFSVDQKNREFTTIAFAKSTCGGDSGGPVFQVDKDDRHILVGLTSTGDKCTKHSNTNMYRYNVDVRAYVDWICKYSGVCPVEDDPKDEPPGEASNPTQKGFEKNIKS